ncbi:ABC transporter ATP-binding protein [Radiobacillus kanasensis]|uniref:ABC transporter ATP-binding protein n=1 Tax=Radiobacillus kanasensis TaxID=2844358 RepID=UPI001E3DCB85|nr:ABC transporter ATP-binding protein [Radiobacillus kanasensis]UFU01463.1 ABC transporter ATP-binding protein [Radiobacillus kanasensis]
MLKDLSMKFDDVVAVDQLNVTIQEGELVSLLGPSGCGKSTTLFMLAGLYKPTSGDLYFGEKRINDVEPEHREIGMVFQNYALYPHMSVLKNIMFPLKMIKVPKKEAQERAIEIAKLVHIDHLLDRKPGQLSGGQQQRVAIARALVKEPKLLLLDEPLSNLDARLRLEMREEIRRIQQQVGITTIFVTHDQEEAMSISDKVLLMKSGQHQQYSAPQNMYDKPVNMFVGTFMGSPPINMIPVQYNREANALQLNDTKNTLSIHQQIDPSYQAELVLGVRPEDFMMLEDNDSPDALLAKVLVVERIGRDTLLNALIGDKQIRVLIEPDIPIQRGDIVKLGVRPHRYHLFDQDTGHNVLLNQS